MANVGWKRQYETETVREFYQIVKMFADTKPDDARLQAFARKCKLTATMVCSQEINDLQGRNIIEDRQTDCEYCRRRNDGRKPCDTAADDKCVYQQPEEKLRTIIHYFGDEGKHFIEWAGKIIRIREAKACSR